MKTYYIQIKNANDKILSIAVNILEELGAKIKIISTSKSKKEKFYNIEESKIFKDFQKWKKENPIEAEQIKKEINEEILKANIYNDFKTS